MQLTAVILSVAVAAMAASMVHNENIPELTVRIENIGVSSLDIKGIVEPLSTPKTGGIPSFIFKYIMNGVLVAEGENVNFRCRKISDFTHTNGDSKQIVLVCRGVDSGRSSTGDQAMVFLLTASEQMARSDDLFDMFLAIGSSVLQKLGETKATVLALAPPVLPVPIPIPLPVPVALRSPNLDYLEVVRSSHPFQTLLTYDIPTTRVKRQFGGGFSGSGAQAGASSFGGGGGFGGFPGGGFGGGFSGSQASAGAGSFGGGGGFFG